MPISVDINGGEELLRKLKAMGPAGLVAARDALVRGAEEVATLSKSRFVPVLTGALSGTIHVPPPVASGNEVVVQIVAGGPAAPYAVYVHEINKNYNNNRQWKFLETPLKESLPEIEAELAYSINAAFKGM